MKRIFGVLLLPVLLASLAAGSPSSRLLMEDPIEAEDSLDKRQFPMPLRTPNFHSAEQFDAYMNNLETYLKLLSRQRFGKRSTEEKRKHATAAALRQVDETKLAGISAKLADIERKLDLLLH